MIKAKNNTSEFFETMKARFEKCLWPSMACKQPAINAHSVQNSNALGLISEKDHVAQLTMQVSDGEPICAFKRTSRNKASTFKGFCNHHDTQLFKSIDTKPISLKDDEQLFLLAYRSVTRELHTTMESAMRLQIALEKKINEGSVPKNAVSEPMIAATQHMLKAWGVWKHRLEFYDKPLIKGRFGEILHSTFIISGRKPVLASSSFFSVDNKEWGKRFAAVTLNLVPLSDSETAVVISYPRSQSGAARRYVASVFLKSGEEQLLELSYLLVNRAENFFMLPSHVDAWPQQKRKTIEKEFVGTIAGVPATRSSDLMLF